MILPTSQKNSRVGVRLLFSGGQTEAQEAVNDLLMDTWPAAGEAGTGYSDSAEPVPDAQLCLGIRSNAGA